ncbi:MAG: hypothetical protein FJ151_03350, partial [Euryarchaeota archaeon]|nr:hypothetical protein [Euryarchaeota archaeon]
MVECRSCEGPQDLREAACLDSLVNIMRAENTIDEIILVRELDVAYDKRVVRILRDLARLANLARELTSGWTE